MLNKLKRGFNKCKPQMLPILFGLGLITYFFYDLFWPVHKIFFTPEISGRSDILNFFLPVKDFLSDSLKRGDLPLWNKYAAGGYPVLAESQIGTFNLINFILFGFLPSWLAFDITYCFIFLTAFLGSYLLFNYNGLSKSSSLFSALLVTFGGYFVGHLVHFSLVQALSLTPWLIYLSQKLWITPSKEYFLVFSFVFSQQLLSGHPQTVFTTMIAIFVIFFVIHIKGKPDKALADLLSTFAALTIGVLLSAIQLLPTLELYNQSVRFGYMSLDEISNFRYDIKNLITIVKPFYNGNLKDGSFVEQYFHKTGFPGETMIYLGTIPFILSIVGLFKKHKSDWDRALLCLSILSVALFMVVNSPLSFLYYIPPFNTFREPARYLILLQLSLAYFAGSGLDSLTKILKRPKKIGHVLLFGFLVPLLLATILDLNKFFNSFNGKIEVDSLFARPKTIDFIPPNSKLIHEGSKYRLWNNYILEYGWGEIDAYNYFKNSIDENSNLLFDLGHYKFYTPLLTKRQNLTVFIINPKTSSTFSVEYITSTRELSEFESLEIIGTVEPPNISLPKFYVYKNLNKANRFRFVSNYLVMPLSVEMGEFMMSDGFDPKTQVVLEKPLGRTFEVLENSKIEVIKDEHTKTLLKTETDKDSILVISDSYYPGWVAKIDGVRTKIHPANINQRAIVVPAGEHFIEFVYRPWSFYIGAVISLLTLFSLIAYIKYDRRVIKYLKTRKRK